MWFMKPRSDEEPAPPPKSDVLPGIATLVCLLASALLWRRRRRLPAQKEEANHAEPRRANNSRWEILAYRMDNFFSTSPYAPGLLLLAITAALVILGGLGLWLALCAEGKCAATPLGAMWEAWRFVTDGGEYHDGLVARLVGVCLVLSGMLFFALLVGLIGESIEAKIDSLKQGKGPVIEENHTLVLGWSDKFVPFAREVAKANESEGGGVIVVLSSEFEKEEMDERVLRELPPAEMGGTRVVCRHGDPVALADLKRCAADTARAVVLLSNQAVPADISDAFAVRCVLALRAGLGGLRGHLVVELCDVDNLPLLSLVAEQPVGSASGSGVDGGAGPPVLPIVPHDIIGRLMIQCARQPHLSSVYEQLLGFDGMEFYFSSWPQLVHTTWGEALFSFPDACPIGVRKTSATLPATSLTAPVADASFAAGGATATLLLNPPDDYVVRPGDELVFIAEDDDKYAPQAAARPEAGPPPSTSPASISPPAMPTNGAPVPDALKAEGDAAARVPAPSAATSLVRAARAQQQQHMLLCGWRRDLLDMLLVRRRDSY